MAARLRDTTATINTTVVTAGVSELDRNGSVQAFDAVETIRRRMARSEEVAGDTDEARAGEPSSISRARCAALSSRLAQLAARAAADCLAVPARAHEAVPMETVLRLLSDVRRITEAIAAIAGGSC